MLERLIIIAIGSVFFYLVRFKIIRKPYSPLKSGIVATLIMVAGIQFHYHFLPYETFKGGITYTSLAFIAFLIFQYGYRRSKSPRPSAGGKE